MTRYATATLALLLTAVAAGSAAAQQSKASPESSPITNAAGMSGEKEKNAELSAHSADKTGATDVSPGVGSITGAGGKPPVSSGAGK